MCRQGCAYADALGGGQTSFPVGSLVVFLVVSLVVFLVVFLVAFLVAFPALSDP